MNNIEKKRLNHVLQSFKNKFNFKSLHKPVFSKKDKKYLEDALIKGWVSTKGPSIKKFEKNIKKKLNKKFCVATNTGTAALFIALKSIGIKKGDEILLPNLTFVASLNSILYCEAVPNIIDTNADNPNISVQQLKNYLKKIVFFKKGYPYNKFTNRRIFGIMTVHVYGHICDMEEIYVIAKEYNLKIIEDAAEALGSKYKNKHIGSFSDISAVSFNGNKIITTGAGGVILTNFKRIYLKALNMSTINNINNSFHQNHFDLGYNLRMPSINANLGLSQLSSLNKRVQFKRNLFKKYEKFFNSEENIFFDILKENQKQRSNYWLQCLIIKKKYSKYSKFIINQFIKKKITVRTMWLPMSKVIYNINSPKSKLKNSINLYSRIICLPSN